MITFPVVQQPKMGEPQAADLASLGLVSEVHVLPASVETTNVSVGVGRSAASHPAIIISTQH